MRLLKFLILSCIIFAIFGCTGGSKNQKTLGRYQESFDVSQKSIALISLKISNQYHPSYPLDLVGLFIRRPQGKLDLYKMIGRNGGYVVESEGYKEYWIAIPLNPGVNIIEKIWAFYDGFLTDATSHAPVFINADIKANSVLYLGHVDIVLREKKDESEESAPSLQFVAAGLVGFYTGTFDYIISDKFDDDMKIFESKYPAFKNATIEKAILPQWVRADAQGKN